MEGVTLTFAIIVSLLVVTLRPRYAMVAYIASLLWYPTYLAVSIGTIELPVGRIVVSALLLRCLLDDRIRSGFNWSRLDTWVALSMLAYFSVGLICFVAPFSLRLEGRLGFLMDTWCAYLAVRFIVTSRARLISIIKCISILLVPLAVLGVIESISGWQPFYGLWHFCPWYYEGTVFDMRWGLTRAVGPFGVPILFGIGFALFLPLIYCLRHEQGRWRSLAYVLSAVAVIGALSSLSSGPWVMVIVVISCLAMEKYRQWIKPLLVFFIISCMLIGIISNRRFYHVLATRIANPLSGTGWHRAMLIDLAIEHFDEWWLTGYGGEDPGWGPSLGMTWTDVTNEYILTGVRYGALGVIALCVVLTATCRRIVFTYKRITYPAAQSLCWALGSLLVPVMVTWMSISFFGQLMPLFYGCLGIIVSVCDANFNWNIPNSLSLKQSRSSRIRQ